MLSVKLEMTLSYRRIVVLHRPSKGELAMAKGDRRAKRSQESRLESDLTILLDRHADHSVIREALDRMSGANAQGALYTTYPACHSNS
jgi:hypothetical protein